MSGAELLALARRARENAYAPYSGFAVGAALLGADGRVYTGCNVENAAYGPSNCAERTAVFKAVSEGERRFAAIAVVGGPGGRPEGPCPPGGVCRQVLRGFCTADFPIHLRRADGSAAAYTLGQLLPESFSGANLEV